MAEDWTPLPLDKPLFANLDENAVGGGYLTAIENGFQNELGGHTRFPGLEEVVDLGGDHRVFLHDFNDNLVAATQNGQVYTIDRSYTATNVTGLPVSGGRRPIFAKSDRDLFIAAGGPIVRLRADKTEVLSSDAPDAIFVGWIDNFTIAVETNSGRFYHSNAGSPDVWDPLDTFAADGSPDNINSMIITPFRELMLGGPDSVEQFDRLPTGDVPFFRRWSVGDGVKLPYVVLFADNALWTINKLTELVRFSGQQSVAASNEVGRLLEQIDDWSEAWFGGYPDHPLHILGQKFILLQAPNATNVYGTKGVTLCYDYRQKRFFSLYGWDSLNGVPSRWPGWSHWRLWDTTFVGGEGKIYKLTDNTYRHGSASALQRWLVRTSHMSTRSAGMQIARFRLRVVRGVGGSATAPSIRVRCSRDSRPFGPWISRSLGRAGDRVQIIEFGSFGNGATFQFEISSADDCRIDLHGAEVVTVPLGH